MELAVELWHLLIAGAAGVGAILLLWARIKALTGDYKSNAINEALRIQNVELRLTSLEEKDQVTQEMLTRIFENVSNMRSESTKQHSDLKHFVRDRIDELKSDISRRDKDIHERINKLD